jgi:Zn-dependent protease with chaperone function
VNFFEHQDRARRQSRWLLLLFVLAVLAIVVAIDAVLLIVLGSGGWEPGAEPMPVADLLSANSALLAGGAAVTLGVIGLASLGRIVGLRSGGGQVARQLGGTLIGPDTRDAKRRRLRNVVEEIALAAGVPVPEIYVLEQESGINAFAAGYTPADAAVAVTRGALDRLDRDELQGVIAHEFSHILNGDMRINIRLMGALFGIMLLATIGRRVLMHANLGRSSRERAGVAILLVAFGLMAVGYIGLFFARWIKAALSRQREYLADASAVQFTRDPAGIGGALKKIAVYSGGSYLNADSEEISHMLFGDGRHLMLFSTHPPLGERIRRIDPDFRDEDLQRLAARIRRAEQRDAEGAAAPAGETSGAGGVFDAGSLIDRIGQPGWEQMLLAAALAASIPKAVRRAAHSDEWAPEVLLYTLLDADPALRDSQLLQVAQRRGADSEARVRALLDAGGLPDAAQRLPLLELALPALKRRPPDDLVAVLETARALSEADARIDVYEYLLGRLIAQHLWESQNPQRARLAGGRSLDAGAAEARYVLAMMARHGNEDPAAAQAAFRAGLEAAGLTVDGGMPATDDWARQLDAALMKLDRLQPQAKSKLVVALATVALHDGAAAAVERELLRLVCALIHVPLPLLRPAAS